MKMNSHQTF